MQAFKYFFPSVFAEPIQQSSVFEHRPLVRDSAIEPIKPPTPSKLISKKDVISLPLTKKVIYISHDEAGRLIGYNGKNIMRIRIESKAEIKIDTPRKSTVSIRKIVITGTQTQIECAETLITASLKTKRANTV